MNSTNETRTSTNICSDGLNETEVKDEVEVVPLTDLCLELEYSKEE